MTPMKLLDRRLAWLPPAAWMALIWRMSADSSSGVKSLRIARFIWGRLLTPLTGHIPNYPLLFTTDAIFRKLCHVGEYAILAGMLYAALTHASPLSDRAAVRRWTVLLTVGWAALDELHQAFVPGRSAHVSDVAIDSLGAGLALVLIAVALWLHRPTPTQS
jgi:VanZ family protein